ncbi:MAG: hypothetical protein RLZZ28_1704 [Bacteroidota bacterium]|jgi:four helix bundle protein
MIIESADKNTNAFFLVDKLVASCYQVTKSFPAGEKYELAKEITNAASLVQLNITESFSKQSIAAHKKHCEIARDWIVAIDNALDLASAYGYTNKENLAELNGYLLGSFQLLSKLINQQPLIASLPPNQI